MLQHFVFGSQVSKHIKQTTRLIINPLFAKVCPQLVNDESLETESLGFGCDQAHSGSLSTLLRPGESRRAGTAGCTKGAETF